MKRKVLALTLSLVLICSSTMVVAAAGDVPNGESSLETVSGETAVEDDAADGADKDEVETEEIELETEEGNITDEEGLVDTSADGEGADEAISAESAKDIEIDDEQDKMGIDILSDIEKDDDVVTDTMASGICGDNLTWVLTSDGTLTISGTGPMYSGALCEENPDFGELVKKVVIEDGVTSIGGGAFMWAHSLTEVNIPDSVTNIQGSAFWQCTSLKEITIPDSVTSIEESAFWGCTGLEKIVIPAGVTDIEQETFYGCSGLRGVIIPDSVTAIGEEAFSGCSSLTEITIADSVTSIGVKAFFGCINLRDVTISEDLTNIGGSAFGNTPWQEAALDENGMMIIHNVLIDSTSDDGVITIPENVTSISERVFSGKDSLNKIVIPDSVTNIEDEAFSYARNLTDVTIPNNLTTIQYGTFYGCKSLESVDIPTNVTSIEGRAFFNTALKSVTIPENVTSIGEYAFGYTGYYNVYPVENFTIYGYTGSAAEKYADENSFIFVALSEPESELEIIADKTDEEYSSQSGTGVTIYCSGDFEKFVSVQMDGETVDPQNYVVEEGSTILTFASEYLDTLSIGEHIVRLNYIDGSIDTYLTVKGEEEPGDKPGAGDETNPSDPGTDPTPGSDEDPETDPTPGTDEDPETDPTPGTGDVKKPSDEGTNGKNESGNTTEDGLTTGTNAVNNTSAENGADNVDKNLDGRAVKTGDQTNVIVWMFVGAGALIACAAVLETKRKRHL